MDEEVIKRVPPNSVEAERSVIAAMLMDRDAVISASEILSGDDFYNKQYGVVFECLVDMVNHGDPIDMVTVTNRLKENDQVSPETASLEFVREMMLGFITSANIKQYAQIVHDKALMRKIIQVNDAVNTSCYQGKEEVDTVLETMEASVFDLVKNRRSGDFVPIRQVVLNCIDKLEAASRNHSAVTGIPTGFIDLDRQLSGFQPSDLILIAARPSMGKTAFALNCVHHMIRNGECCVFFSLEMSAEQLMNRLLAMDANVDAQNLRNGNLTDSDWNSIFESAGNLGSSNLIIDDTPGISIGELRSKCRKYKLEHNLKCVFIDYLQLMSGSGRNSDSRQQEVSDISRSLKALAREIECPVIALSQLSRACEARTDHRPMLSDLRESGAIEQDADVVMFLYRDEYYDKDSKDKGITELIVAKQRNGPTGTVRLAWIARLTKFGDPNNKVQDLGDGSKAYPDKGNKKV